MKPSLYCFTCGETKAPTEVSDNDECLECGCMVEWCEWDYVDEVFVPAPPFV